MDKVIQITTIPGTPSGFFRNGSRPRIIVLTSSGKMYERVLDVECEWGEIAVPVESEPLDNP
jgi:hypothetical protein